MNHCPLKVQKVVQTCFYFIKKIDEIKSILTLNQLPTLVCTCVFSNMDYCNSALLWNKQELDKEIASSSNSAIHLLKKRGNKLNTSTEELLRELHWLPVHKRIVFKVLLLMHKCLLGKHLSY